MLTDHTQVHLVATVFSSFIESRKIKRDAKTEEERNELLEGITLDRARRAVKSEDQKRKAEQKMRESKIKTNDEQKK